MNNENLPEHRVKPGAAKSFWDAVDRISGKGPRKKVGSGLTAIGIVMLLVDLIADGGLSLVLALPAGAGAAVGLFMRFFPGRRGTMPTEEEVVATVKEAQELDIESLPAEKQTEVAEACGLSIHGLVQRVNLVTESASELARKLGSRIGAPFEEMKKQVEKNGGDPRCLSKKDRIIWDIMQYAGALRIKETVEEPAA
jgi:hypothetical protein